MGWWELCECYSLASVSEPFPLRLLQLDQWTELRKVSGYRKIVEEMENGYAVQRAWKEN